MWYCGSVISVVHAGDQRGGARSLERLAVKHPRAIRQGMGGVDFASLDGQPERSGTDAEHMRGFCLNSSILQRSVDRDRSKAIWLTGTEPDHSFSGSSDSHAQ